MLAFVQSYSQSQARLRFTTTLGMDNFDRTKMNALQLIKKLGLPMWKINLRISNNLYLANLY